jgi:hypothetical protein
MSPAVYKWAIRHGVTMAALQELAGRVAAELAKFGIDGTVDAAAYFSNQG